MRINIGCGDKFLTGWVNLDLPFDATQPWPFMTASLQAINADCVLPHIPPPKSGELDPLANLFSEVARCLKPGGVFTFSAPDWRKPSEALQDVYHYRLIGPRTLWHCWNPSPNRPLEVQANWFLKPSFQPRKIGIPLEGESRIFPNLLPMGLNKAGVLTHLAYRLNWRFLLQSGRLDWRMERNGVEWF